MFLREMHTLLYIRFCLTPRSKECNNIAPGEFRTLLAERCRRVLPAGVSRVPAGFEDPVRPLDRLRPEIAVRLPFELLAHAGSTTV
jgi:hypothetical protein